MTTLDELVAMLMISVMPELEQAEISLEAAVAALMARAETGKRSARDTFNNPWGSSTSPGVAAKQLRAGVNELDAELAALLPATLSRILLRRTKRDQLAAVEARLTPGSGPVTASDLEAGSGENEGYARMIMIMRDLAGLKDRTCRRASKEVIQQAARIIARSEQPRVCDDLVTWDAVRAAGKQLAVCSTEGWSPSSPPAVLAERWRRNEEAAKRGIGRTWVTWLPKEVDIDPPQLPRDWRLGAGLEVYPATWDAFPADALYQGFIRELMPDERPFFLRYEDLEFPVSPFPQWEDVASFRQNDPAFDKAFRDAQNDARIFDGYHARHMQRLTHLIAEGTELKRKRDLDLFNWCAPFGERIIPHRGAWDAWRPWGTLFAALKVYLKVDDLPEIGSILVGWAYLLYGRHLRDRTEFPAFVRKGLFDWHMMPVSSNLYGAVRYLVPRPGVDDPDDAFFQTDGWALDNGC